MVYLPLWKMMEFVSWCMKNMKIIPNTWKNKKSSKPTTGWCPPSYKLVYKPHEYYGYICHKPVREMGVICTNLAIPNWGTTLQPWWSRYKSTSLADHGPYLAAVVELRKAGVRRKAELQSQPEAVQLHQHRPGQEGFDLAPNNGEVMGYPAWWTYILPWKITIFNGKIHYFYGHFQLLC